MQDQLPDLSEYFTEWREDLEQLRQNHLLAESAFLSFAKDRGVPVFGVMTGDPGLFVTKGWLKSDQATGGTTSLFHPFRIYPLNLILRDCGLPIAASAFLHRDSILGLVERVLESRPNIERIEHMAIKSNRIVDLAILLEPIYWPRISGWQSGSFELTDSELEVMRRHYKTALLGLVRSLDPDLCRSLHETLRIDAAVWDPNTELYLLLRLSSWERRQRLRGGISGALWVRHIAETIRRAFEEAHSVEWEEEDQAFGLWPTRGRKIALGSERPLDTELKSKPHIAWWFGLFTGSVVRWYVEGYTEYHAIRYVLLQPSEAGIELMNLEGMIRSEKANAALTLQQLLIEDKAQRRFSVISFDRDVPQNLKVVRAQVKQENVVGLITGNEPDFEFANFTIEELAEVAARIDETYGFAGDVVRFGNWEGVTTARTFQERYKRVSARRPAGLKGKQWGEALAAYALEHPNRADVCKERPFWGEVRAALNARIAHYDYQKKHFGIDPDTFEQVDLRVPASTSPA